jgi:hypothetical protein
VCTKNPGEQAALRAWTATTAAKDVDNMDDFTIPPPIALSLLGTAETFGTKG